MFRVKESQHVQAPLDRVFLLATSVPLVQQILGLKPVSGVTNGLIVAGDRVKWRGWKFGIPVNHHTLITRYERPAFFQDTMESGYFKHFQHDHQFDEVDGHTLMVDIVRFSMPLGPVGREVGKQVVVPEVLRLLTKRFQMLKRIAEGPDWERYIDNARPVAGAYAGIQRA